MVSQFIARELIESGQQLLEALAAISSSPDYAAWVKPLDSHEPSLYLIYHLLDHNRDGYKILYPKFRSTLQNLHQKWSAFESIDENDIYLVGPNQSVAREIIYGFNGLDHRLPTKVFFSSGSFEQIYYYPLTPAASAAA